MQRFVAHAQERAVGHAKAKTVGGDRGAFHVQRDRAALAEAALRLVGRQQLPVAVVGAGHGAGAHDAFELGPLQVRHIFDGLLQGHLDLGQRRDRYPQRQFFVKHMVFAHITVGQHVVAQLLAAAQAGAVAQHQPGVRPEHGHVVGDVFGVGRADADVDHGDAAAVGAQQVIARHLRQTRRCQTKSVSGFGRQTGAPCHHIARLDKGHIGAALPAHFFMAQAHELVDVKLVVGEQHKVLKPVGRGACVVAQALQRVIDPRRREQRQRLRLAGARFVSAVGNAIVHGGQVGQVKGVAHQHAALGAQAAFNVVALGK